MGCRPSKHATSKIRDAHARGMSQCTCMYSPRKYNKKHKCNSNGTGSKRTSGGTQNGSHGNSSTGHRSRSYKSDESDFPAFSTTSAVYRRGTSKASKITLRLSSDGSTLEIEQCDYSIANSMPPIRTASRPWSSTPNLVKMSNKGSPMFQNMDLHLRPSASVWTNTSATRSTPGSAQPSVSWQAALLREKRPKKESQMSMNEIATETSDIRETVILNDEVGAEGMEEMYIDKEPIYSFNRYRPVFSVHGHDISRSNHSYRPMSHRHMSMEIDGKFDLSRPRIDHESASNSFSSSASPNHNLNLYCLSQFSESSLNNLETKPKRQHRDKCTASLRNPEVLSRSEFSNNIHFRKAHSNDTVGHKDTSFNRFEAKKHNQRYSIPRYDCFRIADYDDINDHSSFPDTSNHQEEGYKWVDGWQKYGSPRRRSYHDGPSWTEKLTDRQKLVLNLSTHQHSVDNNGATFTSLVGRRDEDWHSNDNLISSQNLEQPFVSIMNSPVESDAVLTFVELGCPVSLPEKRFNTEMGSPRRFYSPAMPASQCDNQCDGGTDDACQDKSLAEISDQNNQNNQNNSDICKGCYSSRQLSTKNKSSSNVIARKDHEKAIIACACPTEDPRHLPRRAIVTNQDNRIANKNEENDGDVKGNDGIGIDSDPCLIKSIREYKVAETRTSLLQPGQQMLDVTIGQNPNAFTITPLLQFNSHGPKQENRTGKNSERNNSDENGFRWSGRAGEEGRASFHEANLKNIDENGNCNANKQGRSKGNEEFEDGISQYGAFKTRIEVEGTDRVTLLKILKNQNTLRDEVAKGNLSEEDLANLSYFCEDISDENMIVHDTIKSETNAQNHTLPLLCFNNSFGERFQGLNIKYESKPCKQITPKANHNGTLPSLDHDSEIEGAFSLCRDKIDGTFHRPLQSPMMESMGVSQSVTKSITSFQPPIVLEGKNNGRLPSGKCAVVIDAANSLNTLECDKDEANQPMICPTSLASKHENDIALSLVDSIELVRNKEQIKDSSNFSKGYHQADCDQDESNLFDKIAWHSNHDNFYFHGLFPSTKTTSPLARNPVPLRILQARIIGRNISDFANICFYSHHKDVQSFQSITCTTSSPFSYKISSRQAEEDINETWAALKNAYISMSNKAEPLINGSGMNALTKSQLHSKYALTQARLTGGIKQTSPSMGPSQISNVDKNNLSTGSTSSPCQISDLSCLPDVNSSSNEGDFLPKINFSSSSSNTACLPDAECLHTSPLPQAFTSSSSTHSSAGEFTSQEDDSTTRRLCQSLHTAVRPSTMSSKEGHSLINSQLSSSHSSDSLSCTLSTYSLANTLHSDTSNSDTCHKDIIYSDTPHSDAARYDSPRSDSSPSNTVELTSQSHDSQEGICQCLVSGSDTQTLNTPPSSSVRSNTPSSYLSSQSTHSPRSSPLSTISPHSSPCSQCTLSPHSSSSSSPSHQTFQDATESLPDDQSHSYSTPPESASFFHNPSFFFPVSSYSSSPSPLEAHGAEDLELSILTPSISCRSTPAENPKSYKKQGSIDLEDKSGLNLNEIQSSLGNTSCNCARDHSVKWDQTVSERTLQEFQISPLPGLRKQNGHDDDNRSALSDRETVWDSKSSKYGEREGETTRLGPDHETHSSLCAIMGENEVGAINWGQSRGEDRPACDQGGKTLCGWIPKDNENNNRNNYTCDQNFQYCYDYEHDVIQSKSQSNSVTLQNSHINSSHISNCSGIQGTAEVQSEDTHLRLYADHADCCQDLEFSTMVKYDDQSSGAYSAHQCPPPPVGDHHLNECVQENIFRNVSHGYDTSEIWNYQPLELQTRENNSCTSKVIYCGDEFVGNSPNFDRDTQAGECHSKGISIDGTCIELTFDNAEEGDQEKMDFFNLGDNRMEKSIDVHTEGNRNKAVFSDNVTEFFETVHGHNDLVRDKHRSSVFDSECFADASNNMNERNESIQEELTSAFCKSPVVDNISSHHGERKETPVKEQSGLCMDESNTGLHGRDGMFTEMNGSSNQIDMEITKQISAHNETVLEKDTDVAKIPSNTDGSQIEQSRNGDIDSLSNPNAMSPALEEIRENQTERPKRKVQSLVQHFESVSLGGQAETSPFQEL